MRIAFVVPVIVLVSGAVTAPAGARPLSRICRTITDQAGDVVVVGMSQTPSGDEHLDLRSVQVSMTRTLLTVAISDTRLSEERRGIWRLTFTAGRTQLFVTAGRGMWANVGDADGADGFFAGAVGRPGSSVRGSFDYARNRIDVIVPTAAFGAAAPRPGVAVSGFAVEAKEQFASVAPGGTAVAEVTLVDRAASSGRC